MKNFLFADLKNFKENFRKTSKQRYRQKYVADDKTDQTLTIKPF